MKTNTDNSTLELLLSGMLTKVNSPVEIISRKEFYESSTFPVEIINCETADGNNLSLFCKFLGGMGPNNYGHRGGVEYEAKVYAEILDKIPYSKIKYYGQAVLPESNETLLVIEYLGETLRMLYSGDDNALYKAAEWIGKFHHYSEGQAPSFLKMYDKEYFYFWSIQFHDLTNKFNAEYPWLKRLVEFYRDNIELMTSQPQTIIHGEFYPRNILMKEGIIYPVDWESAAVAPGEIDLASLIEGWDKDIANRVIESYRKNRWPSGNLPVGLFEKRLLLSQIYFHFWWWPEKKEVNEKAFIKLKQFAQEAGVI